MYDLRRIYDDYVRWCRVWDTIPPNFLDWKLLREKVKARTGYEEAVIGWVK